MPPYTWPAGGPYTQTATQTGVFQDFGRNPGPNTADLATNPNVVDTGGNPLRQAMMFLGQPASLSPDAIDAFSSNLVSVASAFHGTSTKHIAHMVINGNVSNFSKAHFTILPPVESSEDELPGKSWTVFKLENSLPDVAPELTRTRYVTHVKESAEMYFERYSQGFHLTYDFYRTEAGKMLFGQQAALVQANFMILAAQTITATLLSCKDHYRKLYETFNDSPDRAWNALDARFAVLNKKPKAWYVLSNTVRRLAARAGAGGFDAVLIPETLLEVVAWGSEFETERYRRGEQAERTLALGGDAVQLGAGIERIVEPTYQLTNTGSNGPTNLLSSQVQVGVIGYVNPIDPVFRDVWGYHYLDLEAGTGEIKVQEYEELLYAALCFDSYGELDMHCYNKLITPGGAAGFASRLGIDDLTPSGSDGDIPVIDIFVATVNGRQEIVRYQGNQEPRHCSYRTQKEIVNVAISRMAETCNFDRDMRKIRRMLDIANRNYNVAADPKGHVEAFIWATVGANMSDVDVDIVNANQWGSPNLPNLAAVDTGFGVRGYFVASPDGSLVRTAGSNTDNERLDLAFPLYVSQSQVSGEQARGKYAGARHAGKKALVDVTAEEIGNFAPYLVSIIDYYKNPVTKTEGVERAYASVFYVYAMAKANDDKAAADANLDNDEMPLPFVLTADVVKRYYETFKDIDTTTDGIRKTARYLISYKGDSTYVSGDDDKLLENIIRLSGQAVPSLKARQTAPEGGDSPAVQIAVAGYKDVTDAVKNVRRMITAEQERQQRLRQEAEDELLRTYRDDGVNRASASSADDADLDSLGGLRRINQGIASSRSQNTTYTDNVLVAEVANGVVTLGELDGTLPGFSNMSHMRYLANAHRMGATGNWGKIETYRTAFAHISEGMEALDRITDQMRQTWSLQNNPNLFFHPDNLPYYQRPDDPIEQALTTFQQDVVQGVRYAVGMQINMRYFGGMPGHSTQGYRQYDLPRKGDKSAKKWAKQMGFTGAEKDGDLKDIGHGAFESGNMPGPLADKMKTEAGVKTWQEAYESSPAARTAGLANGTWNTMAGAILELCKQSSVWSNADSRERGAMLARIVAGIDWTVAHERSLDTSGETTDLERLVNMAMASRKSYAGHYTSSHGRNPPEIIDPPQDYDGDAPRYINTRLSLAPGYWKSVEGLVRSLGGNSKYVRYGAAMSILRPADPSAPNNSWLGASAYSGTVPDENNVASFARDIINHARARPFGSLSASMLDPVTKRLAAAPGESAKRARTEEGGRSAHARHAGYAYSAPNTYTSATSDSTGAYGEWFQEALRTGGDQRSYANMHPLAKSPHYGAPETIQHATTGFSDFAPNPYWERRWGEVMGDYSNDLLPRMFHLAFMGLPISAHSFANLARAKIPPPITLLPADPFIELRMMSMVYVKKGRQTGFLGYHLSDESITFDGSAKYISANFTAFFGAAVQDPRNVLIVDHVAYDGYVKGGKGTLVRKVWTEDRHDGPESEYQFNAMRPGARTGDRFVLYDGASRRDADIPDPFPLAGSYVNSKYTGLGTFLSGNVPPNGLASACLLLVNLKAGFWRLNNNMPAGPSDELSWKERKAISESRFNLVCSRANQWGPDRSTGSIKQRRKRGTGPLGVLCEGVRPILDGNPGCIEELIARVE